MKKTYIVIGIILFLLVLLAIGSNSLTSSAFQYETIQQSSLVVKKDYLAQVKSNETILSFYGTIQQVLKQEGSEIKEKEKMLIYQNEFGKNVSLHSPIIGYVKEIGNNYVLLMDKDYYIETYVPFHVYNLLHVDQEAILNINNQEHLVVLKEKFPLPIYHNGQYQYKLHYKSNSNINLFPLQETLLTISFETKTGFCVTNDAIYKDEEGFFLLESSFQKDLNHYENHRIAIQVIYADDEKSIIEGIGLEDLEVCIIDELVKKVLFHD